MSSVGEGEQGEMGSTQLADPRKTGRGEQEPSGTVLGLQQTAGLS